MLLFRKVHVKLKCEVRGEFRGLMTSYRASIRAQDLGSNPRHRLQTFLASQYHKYEITSHSPVNCDFRTSQLQKVRALAPSMTLEI